MSAGTVVLWAIVALGTAVADARWLRVAQREHYRAGRVTAMNRLWAVVRRVNLAVFILGAGLVCAGAVVSGDPGLGLSAAGVVVLAAYPLGLSPRATSAPFAFTPRMRRVIAILVVLQVVSVLGEGPREGAFLVVFAFLAVDLALLIAAPVERRLGRRFVRSAQTRLARVRPTIVAITGSYGKTSTKLYAAQLIGGSRTVAASPASFNNLMGLSRAVNERLPEGTEVFIAEMGTYGPGEIRELCTIFPPDVSAITTIGEAHLERMRDRATIVRAKSEITERAATVVLNVDVPELALLADSLEPSRRVLRVSTRRGAAADATVADLGNGSWSVSVRGEQVAELPAPPTGHPTNLAVAVGLALAVDVPAAALVKQLDRLPQAAHRAEVATTAEGVTIIDDTYNANPDGAAQALAAARDVTDRSGGRVFTITPGMIELGPRQWEANSQLAAAATAAENMSLAATGRTNREALLAGATGPGSVTTYPDRAQAARAVLAEARAGDVIVYENDLPDHYP